MLNKSTVIRVTAILRLREWVNLTELEKCGSDARQAVDVLHWSGVIRSRESRRGLEYQWIDA
jgi:hypothetical protein